MNLVSIIMTCHNGEAFLQEALDSVIGQTYSNWELIFYDNNSTDKSKAIIDSYQDNRIKYFKSEKLLNLGTIRNLSLNYCKGEYICFLDTDDYWSKFKLEKQIDKFKTNQNIDIVYSNYFEVRNQEVTKKEKKMHRGNCQNEIILSYIKGSPLTAWLTLMIKKSSIDKLEYSFDKNTHIASDLDLIIRLSAYSNFDYNDEYFGFYRLHANNESINTHKEVNELNYIVNKYKQNKKINSIFQHKNFSNKILIKYYLIQKLSGNYDPNTSSIDSKFIRLIYFIIKITPNKILKFFIK